MKILLHNLSKREKTILVACVTLITAALVYNFIVEPMAKKWSGLNNEIEIMKLRFRKGDEILKRRLEISQQYKNITSTIKVERGSDEEEMALLLSSIEKLATASGVYITNVKPMPAKELGYYKIYAAEVELEGDISKITKFIYEIQNSPQLLSIKKLILGMKQTASDSLDAKMTVTKIVP